MAFEHNDIATKSGLRAGLGETEMGFEHNDIVTMDVMNAAIAAGGGGGGETVNWLIENETKSFVEGEATFPLPDSITADNLYDTFEGKKVVTVTDWGKIYFTAWGGSLDEFIGIYTVGEMSVGAPQITPDNLNIIMYADSAETVTLSLGIVEE